MKLKKQNGVFAHEFSWFAKKVVCTAYNILGISTLILCVIFGEIANLKRQTLLHVFIKKKEVY